MQAVAVKDTRTACRCREAVLFIPCGIRRVKISSLYQLSCANDSGRMSYRWTVTSTRYPEYLQAVSIRCHSVVSSASKNIVFAIIEDCLWYYDVTTATWTPTASCSKGLKGRGDFSAVTLSAAAPETDQNFATYFLVDLCDLEVTRLSLSDLSTTSERIIGNAPPRRRIFFTRPLNSVQFLAYAGEDYYYCGSSTWILQRDNTSAIWFWNRSSITARFSYSEIPSISSIRYHNIYQLIPSDFHEMSDSQTVHYYMWVLNLHLMRWQVTQRFNEVEEIMDRPASTWLETDMWLIVSGYHTIVIKSMNQMSKIINPMTRREFLLLSQ